MKWFKHFSNARFDPKIMRLIKKYGLKGYGFYFAVIEAIASQLEITDPLPDLEEDAGDIADFFHEDIRDIEEMANYCIKDGLFERDERTNRLVCLKLLTHLDNAMSNNPEIKAILRNFKKFEETSNNFKKFEETSNNLLQNRLDKNRLDKIRLDKIRLDNIIKDENIKYECEFFIITQKDYEIHISAYPHVDVIKEYPKMYSWLHSNPKKRKKNYSKFINNWLATQEKDLKARKPEKSSIPVIKAPEGYYDC